MERQFSGLKQTVQSTVETPHAEKMDYLHHKNCLATQSKTFYPPTAVLFPKNGTHLRLMLKNGPGKHKPVRLWYTTLVYNQHASQLPDLRVGNHVALQHPTSKMWGTYGNHYRNWSKPKKPCEDPKWKDPHSKVKSHIDYNTSDSITPPLQTTTEVLIRGRYMAPNLP